MLTENGDILTETLLYGRKSMSKVLKTHIRNDKLILLYLSISEASLPSNSTCTSFFVSKWLNKVIQ